MIKINWDSVYEIIESPVSKDFTKNFKTSGFLIFEEKINSQNVMKVAEVLRDIRDEWKKNPEDNKCNEYLLKSILFLAAKQKDEMPLDGAIQILISTFTRGDAKEISWINEIFKRFG